MSSRTVLPFKKDAKLEDVFERVNLALHPLEQELVRTFERPEHPVVLIGGIQRSGTTLCLQLLRACYQIGYVSNLMARFWRAPYIGALLARELQRKRLPREVEFISELGTTYGYEGAHEFGFFWQRWFPYGETHQTTERDLESVDQAVLRRELAALESVFEAPMAFKNPIVFSLNILALAAMIPTSVFVICRRDPRYVAQSTLLSRLKYHGNKNGWFSVKPEEYRWLKELPYEQQIAGQIVFTEKRIRESLAQLSDRRYRIIEYSDLCENPRRELERIRSLISEAGYELKSTSFEAGSFENQNLLKIDREEFERLEAALDSFEQQVSKRP